MCGALCCTWFLPAVTKARSRFTICYSFEDQPSDRRVSYIIIHCQLSPCLMFFNLILFVSVETSYQTSSLICIRFGFPLSVTARWTSICYIFVFDLISLNEWFVIDKQLVALHIFRTYIGASRTACAARTLLFLNVCTLDPINFWTQKYAG